MGGFTWSIERIGGLALPSQVICEWQLSGCGLRGLKHDGRGQMARGSALAPVVDAQPMELRGWPRSAICTPELARFFPEDPPILHHTRSFVSARLSPWLDPDFVGNAFAAILSETPTRFGPYECASASAHGQPRGSDGTGGRATGARVLVENG